MTDADILRQAAALVRERATHPAIPQTRWYVEANDYEFNVLADDPAASHGARDIARDLAYDDSDPNGQVTSPLAAHIAGMHPGVAQALADWLDAAAEDEDQFARMRHQTHGHLGENPGLRVARTILGDTP